MLVNYLKIAFRSLLKFKGYASINLVGLALGLATGILIMLYVLDELSFDQFHTKGNRLYRVNTTFFTPESGSEGANETNGWPIGKILEKDYPEVEAVLYSRSASFLLINHNDKLVREKSHFVSPQFFNMFSFPLLSGNAEKVLSEPYSVVISESMQRKYFPAGDALNKTLSMADTLTFVITGVMKDIPSNSHIQADILVSFSTYQALNPDFSFDTGWGNINMRNYVLLKEGTNAEAFFAKTKNIYMDRASDMLKAWGVSAFVAYEAMKDIYLTSQSGNGMGPLGSIQRVYLLSGVAIFAILLACINFINLATARSVYRAKEVGLRKVVGSTRKALISQFLSESFLLTVLSFLIALVLIGLLLPVFNELLNKTYSMESLLNPSLLIGAVILIAIVGLLAGYYPALILSSLRPAEVLKGKLQGSKRGVQLRRSLVVFQFVVSTVLVAGTLVVISQLNFMQTQRLGFDKEEVFVVNAARVNAKSPTAFETFKNDLKSIAFVEEVSFTNALPGTPGWNGQVAFPEGKTGDDAISVEYMAVDETYIKTIGLNLIAGKNFDIQQSAELQKGLILNETAVSMFGWSSPEEAIGKRITSPSGHPEGEVIGVVKDYHQAGLQQSIGPITMDYSPENSYLYAIRYKTSKTKNLIDEVSMRWKKSFPGYDFNYFFLDESFEKQYQNEKRLAEVLGLFAVVTIIIATIGLLGLVSFMVVARTKEIGIRKVLGADVFSITGLLSKEFMLLVLLANVIALPLIAYGANQWLQSFAFREGLDLMLFFWTLVIALLITFLVVSVQTLRAATVNPIDTLRSE
jgi:putative ABC transport system permease protein